MKKSKQLALPFNQLESAITTDLVVQGPSPLRSFVNTDELRTLGISRKDDELLNAIMELGSRYRDESATSPPTLTCPADVSQFSKVQFAKKPDARYLLILVGTKHHVNHAWLYDETPSVRTLLRRCKWHNKRESFRQIKMDTFWTQVLSLTDRVVARGECKIGEVENVH
jgi:hypothetical protein